MRIQDHFSKALQQAIRAHGLPNKTKASQEWFANAAKQIDTMNRKEFLRDQHGRPSKVTTKGLEPGSMYGFSYTAKNKDTLPVWDTHPLIFPFNVTSKHFYGLNMHYLPHSQRAYLMDVLDTLKNNNRYDTSTKLKLSWKILKEVAKREDYEQTVHCYLKNNVKSQMKYILPIEWNFSLYLPLAKGRGKDPEAIKEFMSFQ